MLQSELAAERHAALLEKEAAQAVQQRLEQAQERMSRYVT